jgi:1-acyl-sn-glycerol-3-phosphate acyltransferase
MKLRWRLGKIIAYVLAKVLFGFRVVGQENLQKGSAQILASNHRSNLDPFLVGLASGQEIYFMAKQELFEVSKFFRWLILFWNAIPLPRSEQAVQALKKCSDLLTKGKTVVIFPEGTRNRLNDGLLPFKPGLGFLAVNNQVPVIPVAINGVRGVWNGKLVSFIDKDIYKEVQKLKSSKVKSITVRFGKPIFPNQGESRENYEKITDAVRFNISSMLSETDFQPNQNPHRVKEYK